MSEVKAWSIETLHVKSRVDKKEFMRVKRFSRALIVFKNNKPELSYEIINSDGKWAEVSKEEFHTKADERRSELLKSLKTELLSQIKQATKET